MKSKSKAHQHKLECYDRKGNLTCGPVGEMQFNDEQRLCKFCGCRGEQHKGSTSTCPPTSGWGAARPFPSLKSDGSAKAEARIDEALVKYWASTKTFRSI